LPKRSSVATVGLAPVKVIVQVRGCRPNAMLTAERRSFSDGQATSGHCLGVRGIVPEGLFREVPITLRCVKELLRAYRFFWLSRPKQLMFRPIVFGVECRPCIGRC
jgi:hypothetical protein